MEPGGVEGELSSFCGMYTDEEADFMAELLGNCYRPSPSSSLNLSFGVSSSFCSGNESGMNMDAGFNGGDGSVHSSDMFFKFSQGNGFPSSVSQGSYHWKDSNLVLLESGISMSMETASYLVGGDASSNLELSRGNPGVESALPDNNLQPEKEEKMAMEELLAEYKTNSSTEVSKKRPPNPGNIQKKRKNQKLACKEDEGSDPELGYPVSNSCGSEDNSDPCQESHGGSTLSLSSKENAALNLNGKTRACRGAATDPQSIYARKRRERINERLRILQNLVPNGTKVDISTMLEEAVHYVKFLQLQIKLLSSDDLWMYAPIAYNGMDVGLHKLGNYTKMMIEAKKRE